MDAYDAVSLTCGACLVWSVATAALGQMPSFELVAVCRAVQGVAMAATAPAGYALLARTFDSRSLARAQRLKLTGMRLRMRPFGVLRVVECRDSSVRWRVVWRAYVDASTSALEGSILPIGGTGNVS